MRELLTIGHSTHTIDHLIALLDRHEVTAVADVRSIPASRFNPQFNRVPLSRSLTTAGISYVFLGRELGARPDDASCYVDGRISYDRLARTPLFGQGIGRLLTGSATQRIAIVCAEQEPVNCHRTLLVSRVLTERGATIEHIHADGHLESHDEAMLRLMTSFGLDQEDLFRTPRERLDEAIARQSPGGVAPETD